MKKHTRQSIRHLLSTNFKAVRRALIVLHQRQTEDEQQAKKTKHDNDRGFNAPDARRGSELALKAMQPKLMEWNEVIEAKRLVMKYAGQLARIANAKQKAATPAVTV